MFVLIWDPVAVASRWLDDDPAAPGRLGALRVRRSAADARRQVPGVLFEIQPETRTVTVIHLGRTA